MNAPRQFLVPPTAALRRLAEFLHDTGNSLSPTEAAAQAINEWIAAAQGQYTTARPLPSRGYQWKSVFLPEGTQLRMHHRDESYYARVEGDAIVFQGQRMSPRQMTIAIGGGGHNAWRELAILLPGETKWKPASLLRRANELGPAPPSTLVSPAEAMSAAAACMTEALKAALTLVDHAGTQSLPKYERRVERHRRAQDLMEDACALD